MTDKKLLKEIACKAIDKAAEELHCLSENIWNHPELKYEEEYAHNTLVKFLDGYGFKVDKNYILQTGFRGLYGSRETGGPHVAVLCEYDALPGIGHACGHNLIAEVGAGAGVGIKAAMEAAKKQGRELGLLTVLGTPAEEGAGGKIDMINGQAFDDIDVAMMAHPGNKNLAQPQSTARQILQVKYIGKASHAAAFPWEGINALDAAVLAYTSISLMRQQLKPGLQIHGVITNGGAKPNIIPEETQMEYYLRATSFKELEGLKDKVGKCFNSAAVATGCRVELQWGTHPYYNIINNEHLVNLYKENANRFDLNIDPLEKEKNVNGSTDMGNVSHIVPSIHPFFYIGSNATPHTRDFAAAAGNVKSQCYTMKQAKALAVTVIDVMCDPENLSKIKECFKADTDEK